MAPIRKPRRTVRGVTLLEAVISLSVLLVGIVGMLRLQIYGANSDEGGRSYTQAMEVGRELLAGLQRLQVDNPLLAPHFTADVAPSAFGHLLLGNATVTTTPFTAWSDTTPVAGVTPDSAFITRMTTDPLDGTLPRFQRRWTVWMPTTPITINSSKVIAVSVTWRERGFPQLREVVLYGTVINAAAVTNFAALTR